MTSKITSPDALMMALAKDNRRILSRWRALIYMRRASNMYHPSERRWRDAPSTEQEVQRTIRNMVTGQHLESIPRAANCFVLRDAFGRAFPVREMELLFELNPYTVLMHYSALEYHGFTLDQPKVITAWSDTPEFTPMGTDEAEWNGLEKPAARHPNRVVSQKVDWFRGRVDTPFGVEQVQDGPTPIRVTDHERSLLDAIQHPDRSGGALNVFNAWKIAQDFIDIEKLVTYVDNYNIKLLRQRAGFLAESVGLSHPIFDV